MTKLPPDLKLRVLEAARNEPSHTRPAVVRQTVILLATGAAAMVSIFLAIGGLHAGERPLPFVLGTAAGWACVALWATWVSFGLGKSMLGRPMGRVLGVAVATPPLLFGSILLWEAGFPSVVTPVPLASFVTCFLLTLAMAAGPLVALAVVRRASDPVHPRATGAALGAAAGAWAAVMIDMRCEMTAPSHIALGHVLPAVVFAAIGALLGGRVLGVRAKEQS